MRQRNQRSKGANKGGLRVGALGRRPARQECRPDDAAAGDQTRPQAAAGAPTPDGMDRFFSKWDLLLIAVVAALCAAALLWPRGGDGSLTAEVYVDGILTRRIDLDVVAEPYTISLETDPPARLRVEPGRIRYESAGCPDALCVHTGWLNQPGDTAACLPGRSMVALADGERVFMTY